MSHCEINALFAYLHIGKNLNEEKLEAPRSQSANLRQQ